jgi:hypothetical protein
MIVHAVIAMAAVAAVAFVGEATGASVGRIGPEAWSFLLRAALVGMLVTALPATVTGITERGHMYVNWHGSHRAKLALSLVLIAVVAAELAALAASHGPIKLSSWLALAVLAGNPLVCLGLSYYGLRITLGRQSLSRTSYTPDMACTPPVDILADTALDAAQQPAVIDVMKES